MSAGHVYVLAFDNGTVKVGQTQNASQRMSTHKSTARGFGLTVTGEWVSPLHTGWRANEDALKAIAADLGGTARLGGVMQLILNQENQIRRQYDTVLAIQRRLNGPAN